MSLVSNTATLSGALTWKQTKTVSGFNASEQEGNIAWQKAVTAHHPYFTTFTLAASASQTIDFRAITTALGESITAVSINTVVIEATATVTGGKLLVEPGATNGLVWPFADASDAIELGVGTAGARLQFNAGTNFTIDGTHKTWDLTNSGTQTITVKLGALVLTA